MLNGHTLYRTSALSSLPPYARRKLVFWVRNTVIAGETFAVVRDYTRPDGEFLIRPSHLLIAPR